MYLKLEVCVSRMPFPENREFPEKNREISFKIKGIFVFAGFSFHLLISDFIPSGLYPSEVVELTI